MFLLFSDPFLLAGGFINYYRHYPTLCAVLTAKVLQAAQQNRSSSCYIQINLLRGLGIVQLMRLQDCNVRHAETVLILTEDTCLYDSWVKSNNLQQCQFKTVGDSILGASIHIAPLLSLGIHQKPRNLRSKGRQIVKADKPFGS